MCIGDLCFSSGEYSVYFAWFRIRVVIGHAKTVFQSRITGEHGTRRAVGEGKNRPGLFSLNENKGIKNCFPWGINKHVYTTKTRVFWTRYGIGDRTYCIIFHILTPRKAPTKFSSIFFFFFLLSSSTRSVELSDIF